MLKSPVVYIKGNMNVSSLSFAMPSAYSILRCLLRKLSTSRKSCSRKCDPFARLSHSTTFCPRHSVSVLLRQSLLDLSAGSRRRSTFGTSCDAAHSGIETVTTTGVNFAEAHKS